MTELPFYRSPAAVPADKRTWYTHRKRGLHRFFRHMHLLTQQRFVDLTRGLDIASVFLHGNPHLANYARNLRGVAMVDFDRARYGPYAYDIVRFLMSVSLRTEDDPTEPLAGTVLDSFRRGYLYGAAPSVDDFEEMRELRKRKPKKWQRSITKYVASKKGKWVKRLRDHECDPTRKRYGKLFRSYLESRAEADDLERFRITAAAEVPGSMGKIHTLLLVKSKGGERKNALRLIDVKEVYDEDDFGPFHNPFPHNGQRMVAAGELYAPNWEVNPGWASHKGREYWVREIAPYQEKFKQRLSPLQQVDICFAVGSQLGRAHHASADDGDALRDHLVDNYKTFTGLAHQMTREIVDAHTVYLDELASAA